MFASIRIPLAGQQLDPNGASVFWATVFDPIDGESNLSGVWRGDSSALELIIREGDVAAILGWGFAPWSGGPFAWLDIMGADKVVAICDGLAQKHGPRFNAPALLREVADKGETFYGRFGPEAKKAA